MITQEYLKECLVYDPETGIFTWRERPREHFNTDKGWKLTNTRMAGKTAGCPNKDGYLRINIDGSTYLCSYLAWLYVYNDWPVMLDHKNCIRSDNKISNLRKADMGLNKQNHISPYKNNALGILGVRLKRGRYEARIQVNGKLKHIGCFRTKEEAFNAYVNEKRKLHPYGTI